MRSFRARQAEQPVWRKARFCGSGECIEVSELNGMVVMRDSKNPHGPMLQYTVEEWRSFVRGIKAAEFDDLGG